MSEIHFFIRGVLVVVVVVGCGGGGGLILDTFHF